ncbi:MAG: hypothetical protein LBU47_00415 [Christensenellaceae bacterium]|jgi:hypothetical protein|nr:hypothetical protein [Christensenellaceae bacterium]
MLEFILRWAVPCVCGALAAFGGRLCAYQRTLGRGLQALLRDRIIQLYGQIMQKGFCPIGERENLEALREQYRALGGNGQAEDLVRRCLQLPTEEGR